MEPKQRKSVTTAIKLETRTPRKDSQYPVKLRMTFERIQKYYTIRYTPEKIGDDFTEYQKFWLDKTDKGISMTEKEFNKVKQNNPMEPYKTMTVYLSTIESEAITTAAKLKPFTFEGFEEKYFAKTRDDQDVFAALELKATTLHKDGKIGTAVFYENTVNSLKDFTGRDRYPFSNITVKFLKNYEKWMMARKIGKSNPRNISITTVSMYLRCLRSVFKKYADKNILSPFGKEDDGKYTIPSWNENKRALTQADVGKIALYPVIDGTLQHKSRDLWLFSYLCNGINFKDIANLKYSNIKGDTIVFERAKTAKKGKKPIKITVIITRQIGRIIERWSNKPGTQDQFLFQPLHIGMTAEDQHRAIAQMVKNTNKYMKRICADLEIPEATTYVARHSFATVLKRSGASVEYISESLGHKNISTTQNYLKDFEIEEKRKWAEMLLPETE